MYQHTTLTTVLVSLVICFMSNQAIAEPGSRVMDAAVIKQRIAPIGQVRIAEQDAGTAAADSTGASGDKIYEKYCHVCHAAGLAGAPKLGDKAAWGARVTKGIDTLVTHVLNGYNAMPPKGTCAECDKAQLKAAVEYMLEQSK